MAVKILAAEDSATMRRVLEMTFAGEPVQMLSVESGEAAVERASQWTPDLVVADASMERMDGYDVARALKTNPATQRAAVILLASQHTPFDAKRAKECGVDDHVLKPFDTQAMIEKAKEVLSRPRASPTGGAVQAAGAPPAAPSSTGGARGRALPPRPPGQGSPRGRPPGMSPRSTVAFGATTADYPPLQRGGERGSPAAGARDEASRPIQPPPSTGTAPAATTATRAARPAPQAAAAPALGNQPAPQAAPQASRSKPKPSAPEGAARVDLTPSGLSGRLEGLGLTPEQVDGVLKISREVIEQVVWEVVPDLAEVLIREEIDRLTNEG